MAIDVAAFSPLAEFVKREGALVVLTFVLIHKIGDTLANLTLRLLFQDLGFTNDEIAFYDVGVGFVALLAGWGADAMRSGEAIPRKSTIENGNPLGSWHPRYSRLWRVRPAHAFQ